MGGRHLSSAGRDQSRGTRTTLVVGGAGYLGIPLVETLLQRGQRVRILDRLAFGVEPLAHLSGDDRLELVRGDLRSLDRLPRLFEGIDDVVHLGALSDEATCASDPRAAAAINVAATGALAGLARAAGVGRFLFASSCGVYGESREPCSEDATPRPVGVYACSKLEAERAIAAVSGQTLPTVVLRLATLYGLAPRMRFDLVLNQMARDGAERGCIRVDRAEVHRPLLHVRDAARAILLALEAPLDLVRGQVFNLGGDAQNLRVGEIAEIVRSTLPSARIQAANGSAATPPCCGYRVRFAKIRELLGFEPRLGPAAGAREIVAAIEAGTLESSRERGAHDNASRYAELRRRPVGEQGEPVRAERLPFALPSLGPEEEAEVVDTLRSGWLTAGPKTRRFERSFAERVGAGSAVATNSGTAALHLALAALGVGPGDEVITSPITFPATASVVFHQGARPVFVDVDPRTLNLDVGRLEAAISRRTRVILPVHFAGNPCPMPEILALARARGIAVVEDAAHAVGARVAGRPVGALGDATCFSFYPIKNMTAAEGGMVTTDDAELAARARLLSMHGLSRDAWSRHDADGALHWETVAAGFKYNMSDLQAGIGLAQLRKLDGFLARRRALAAAYAEGLADLPSLRLLEPTPGCESAHHLQVVILDLDRLRLDRDGFALALRAERIGTGIHFRSLHLQPLFRERLGLRPEDLPVAADVSRRLLSLPLYPAMSDQDRDDVVLAVRKIATYYAR